MLHSGVTGWSPCLLSMMQAEREKCAGERRGRDTSEMSLSSRRPPFEARQRLSRPLGPFFQLRTACNFSFSCSIRFRLFVAASGEIEEYLEGVEGEPEQPRRRSSRPPIDGSPAVAEPKETADPEQQTLRAQHHRAASGLAGAAICVRAIDRETS